MERWNFVSHHLLHLRLGVEITMEAECSPKGEGVLVVLHDALPSKEKLKKRHVAMESFCEVCGDPDESVYHVIWQALC
jgi:hypothetical protein